MAAVLLLVGYKLANPITIIHFWKKNKIYQCISFIATFSAVVATDLLTGVALRMMTNIVFILIGNLKRAHNFNIEDYRDGDVIKIDLAQEFSFLNKAAIKNTLNKISPNSKVDIIASSTVFISHDVLDLIVEFKKINPKDLNLKVKLSGFKDCYDI